MKKHLKIKVAKVWGKILVKIIEQTHRTDDFGVGGTYSFEATNHLVLQSVDQPEERITEESIFFVRGSNARANNTVIQLSEAKLKRLKQAVKEYNEHFKEVKDDIPEDVDPDVSFEVLE